MIAEVQNPADWSDLIAPENPFKSAIIVGENIPNDVYMRQEPNVKRGDLAFVMSRGELMEFAHCPHRWVMGYKEGGTTEKEWGSVIDCMASGTKLESRFVICPKTYPDTKTGEQKPWTFAANFCKAWRDEQKGKEIVKSETIDDAFAAFKVLRADDQICELMDASKKQVMLIAQYEDADTGLTISVKGNIDFAPAKDSEFGSCLADLKTCNNAAPLAWSKVCHDYDYHTQSAIYLDGYNKATGENRNEFRHVIQESYAPWEVGKRWLTTEFIANGRTKYKEALKRYCRCLKDGEWPGYDDSGSMVINGWREVNPLPNRV